MSELTNKSDINVLELLLKISNDVSSIKTDITNLKDSQVKERADISKEIMDVRDDCLKEIKSVEKSVMGRVKSVEESTMGRINSLQAIQNTLVGDVDTLKHNEEKKDAKRWKLVMSFVFTALCGMITAKLPDIISFLVFSAKIKGGN